MLNRLEQNKDEQGCRRARRRWPFAAGVVAIIVLVAVVAGYAWHATPGFCGAFCHTPMDGYLGTYEAEPGQAAVDKWGNEVTDAAGMAAAYHRASDSSITCLSCHEPTLGEQVGEALHWATGDYDVIQTRSLTFVPTERSLAQLTEARGVASEQFCLKSGCHTNSDGSQMTRDDLIELTSGYARNPHVEQHDEVACGECHKAHRASTNYCTNCHDDAALPEGWVSYSDAVECEPVAIE